MFRKAYDALAVALAGRQADLEYLRILHLAASTIESDVEASLERLLMAGKAVNAEQVKRDVAPGRTAVPQLEAPVVDLRSYDGLISAEVAS